MALIKCHECRKRISTEAAACPYCGSRPKPPKNQPSFKKAYLLLGFVFLGILIFGRDEGAGTALSPSNSERPVVDCAERSCLEHRSVAWIDRAKGAVKQKLKDPGSAEFQRVKFFAQKEKLPPLVCGEVNAKNSLGGKAGFQRFISAGSADLSYLETEMPDFENAWTMMCPSMSDA
jgi:hypothetical protein